MREGGCHTVGISNWLMQVEQDIGFLFVEPRTPLTAVYIQMPEEVRERHEEYKRVVKNVRQQFHGTSCSGGCYFHVGVSEGNVSLRTKDGLLGDMSSKGTTE